MSKSRKKGSGKVQLGFDPESLLERNNLRPMQFVHGAFVVSCLAVGGITFLSRPTSAVPRGAAVVQFLMAAGIALWLVGYLFGMWWFNRALKPEALQKAATGPFRGPRTLAATATALDKVAHHLRTAWTVRLTAWSFGPLVSLMSVQVAIQGNLVSKDVSIATTGMFPMVVFLAIALLTFPTVDRVRAILRRSMG